MKSIHKIYESTFLQCSAWKSTWDHNLRRTAYAFQVCRSAIITEFKTCKCPLERNQIFITYIWIFSTSYSLKDNQHFSFSMTLHNLWNHRRELNHNSVDVWINFKTHGKKSCCHGIWLFIFDEINKEFYSLWTTQSRWSCYRNHLKLFPFIYFFSLIEIFFGLEMKIKNSVLHV